MRGVGRWHTVRVKDINSVDTHIPLNDVAVIVLDVTSQTEVTDLCDAMIRQQDIPRRYVSVNTLTRQVHRKIETEADFNDNSDVCTYTYGSGVLTGKEEPSWIWGLTFLADRNSKPWATWWENLMRSPTDRLPVCTPEKEKRCVQVSSGVLRCFQLCSGGFRCVKWVRVGSGEFRCLPWSVCPGLRTICISW